MYSYNMNVHHLQFENIYSMILNSDNGTNKELSCDNINVNIPKFQIKMAPVSKGKVGSDHIVAFNVAVTEWKSKRTEKVMAELDRILSVLSKISDHSVFSTKKPEVMTFMINCQLLLSSLDHKTNTTWTVISLLTTICTRDVTLCHVLRDRTRMLPVCAKLLHSIPPTTQARTVKLLSFMKLVGEGVRISRREAWLSSLIADLVNFLSTPELSSHSLFLLCCLCQGLILIVFISIN